MTKNLPAEPETDSKPSGHGQQGNQTLNIEQYHHHGSDLAELKAIAEIDPELAHKIVDNGHASHRFGLISVILLLGMALFAVAYIAVNQGVFVTIAATALILGIGVLIRVILTGEWSETTWFGKFVHVIARSLGAKTEEDE